MSLTTRGRLMGALFIATFVAIPALILYGHVLNEADFILGEGRDWQISLAALLEIIVALGNIGSALVIYPVIKERFPSLSLSYVASRVVESTIIAMGIASLLGVMALREDAIGAGDPSGALMSAKTLIAFHDQTFLLGPAFLAAIGNGIILSYIMLKSGLVPRRLAMIGVVAGPLALIAALGALFGVWEQVSGLSFLFTFGEMIWEFFVLGLYLAIKGFQTSDNTSTESLDAAPKIDTGIVVQPQKMFV